MAVKFIPKASNAAAHYTGSHAGIGVDSDDNRFYLNPDGTRRSIPLDGVSIVTASRTLTTGDSGKLFIADSTTSIVLTLPATAAGLRYGLSLKQLTSASGHAFSPNAADKIFFPGTTAVDDKDLICSHGTDRVGDYVWLEGDGVDGWVVTAHAGTFEIEG